ncbi:nucleotidyl transferase AbiEii/AbiGii toxin family protein [Sphingomonas sp. GlSt437]|uniref:nucleotidyl transferase AbiEii/AbiGii toxin family protein n=1 Tax=Sphingomonas sp. GlSt437 TaxID=3389970 RepID=UPI003A89657A
MPEGLPSEWPVLFDVAAQILGHAEATIGYPPIWSFGGGTALMLQIDHRESHDIDLFLDDPQLLPFLNPETQGIDVARRPDSYSTDGTSVLKLAFQEIGEIDFICCADILDPSSQPSEVRGLTVQLETPAEIVAKKVYYRGWNFQPRDMFDLAAVAERCGTDYAVDALAQAGRPACEKALAVVDKATPAFVQSINAQLLVRETTRHLIGHAQDISRSLLRQALERAI